jgi:hypothetical protein
MRDEVCPVCLLSSETKILELNKLFRECIRCDFFFIPSIDCEFNLGKSNNSYDDSYWSSELESARERAYGICMARTAEVFVLSTRPIQNFLDIGTGPGYFLDAISKYLPDSEVNFFGVELYPPDILHRSIHPGYKVGWLDQFLDNSIDGGICVEVLEHLTAVQVKELFAMLYIKATDRATFIFNTGLTDYVRKEDNAYLDPRIRGHISIWSIKAIRRLIGDLGWTVSAILNRNWAFLVEKGPKFEKDISRRIWQTLPENMELLGGKSNSKLLYLLGRDSLRAL